MKRSFARPGTTALLVWCSLVLLPWQSSAQVDVPRTRTLPGVDGSPFPYAAPEDLGLSIERMDTLTQTVVEWVRDNAIIGAEILLVKDRRIVLHEAIGWSDRGEALPLERNTLYRIRSMTKPFTGTSVLLLTESGDLGLDDPVADYLPSWRNDRSEEITLRQLLSHSGGFVQGGFPGRFHEYPNLRAAVDAVGEAGPQNPPGDRYEYSDVGSATLGAVAAQVSGMPLERFIEERILRPLGLQDTHTGFSPDVTWAGRMNPTYVRPSPDAEWIQYWHPSQPQRFPFFRASGGLYTTVFDYTRWLNVWMDRGEFETGRLLSEETIRSALVPVVTTNYGLHWEIFSNLPVEGGLTTFGHGGSDGTLAIAFPHLNATALIFTQSRGNRVLRRFVRLARLALTPEN